MTFAGQLIFAGVCVGAVYALIALGLNLTFWATRTLNFGQGSLMMLCAVVAVMVFDGGFNIYLGLLAGVAVAGVIAAATEAIAIRPITRLTGSMGWVVTTLGVGIFLQGFVSKFFGSQALAFPSFLFSPRDYVSVLGVRLSAQYLIILVIALALVLLFELFQRRTAWGRALQAVAADQDLAAVMGIPVRLVVTLSFVASGLLAGVAGALVAQITGTVDAAFGFNLLIFGFVAAVIGGMGNTWGALLGGIFLGIMEKLVGGYVSTAAEQAIAFALLMIMLAVRPEGLLGEKEFVKV
ncbi:branched-chain amino acid ABC transporter permease [Vineibacter terrae]|uniref:Branched-chain amino acid ABC transporter permease n=1 Tax=Vineibacter terrae TaxID=2586908 RepID=A0A5C8PKC4_9HYPH|nr:branched-chain amino acid ABC transporter permease [Vineibacter terrae]TXL74325.1 branched-chain amino acid ABC transporter permease [Vineibacter terrae]HEX2886336.1 branched-chain amino acid ABC transporter permease [Vineibacter terrae]